MKKALIAAICLSLVASMAGCGEKAPEVSDTSAEKPESSSSAVVEESSTEEEKKDEYELYTKVSGTNIYVNYKTGRRKDRFATSITFYGSGTDITVLAYDKKDKFEGDYRDALEYLNDGRIFWDIVTISCADFHDYDNPYIIDIKSTQDVEINGRQMQQFKGTVESSDKRVCYVYGYAFVMDGIPCALTGFVLTKEQEQELIDSITTEVDTMVQTIRDTRE